MKNYEQFAIAFADKFKMPLDNYNLPNKTAPRQIANKPNKSKDQLILGYIQSIELELDKSNCCIGYKIKIKKESQEDIISFIENHLAGKITAEEKNMLSSIKEEKTGDFAIGNEKGFAYLVGRFNDFENYISIATQLENFPYENNMRHKHLVWARR